MTIAEANEPLSNELKQIIARKGLKNLYVAENAGYTAQELSDMLNGRRLIKACDIPKIAKALGVEINYLFGIEKGA
ncbi:MULTISPECIES: helix-turn-helix transcriptional regulator [unclassified Ruminococcus]|jgi:transcriptional regulator with XRE-family HTH domain|uniref:helix-turn-helix domain-containing protein n=1 Tax=unclassified Ruminococcus TaxID=2608920 RepID=UPI00319DE532